MPPGMYVAAAKEVDPTVTSTTAALVAAPPLHSSTPTRLVIPDPEVANVAVTDVAPPTI